MSDGQAGQTVVVEAGSVESAVEEASSRLGCNPEEARTLVLSEGKKFLGFITVSPWKVRVSWGEVTPEEKADQEELERKAIELAEAQREELQDNETAEQKKLRNVDKILGEVENIDVKIDGFTEIRKTPEGIYMVIWQPKGGGAEVELEDIQDKLAREGVVNVDYEVVREAFESNDEQPVKIADYDPELYVDGDCVVTVDPEGMSASLTLLEPKGGNPVDMDTVAEKIREKGITAEWNRELVKKKIDSAQWDKPFEIAAGEPPVDGEDSRISYKYDVSDHIRLVESDDGSVDFKELNLIQNVLKGEAISEKIPATEGKPGKDVYGNPIEATPGKDEMPVLGQNVELSEDGLKLIASIDGQLKFDGDKPSIEPVFHVKGDVDLHTGNIDFIGAVVVEGSVTDGFTIKAQGDVEINKTVGAGFVEATGNIVVKGGIAGHDKARLSSECDIYAKFAESAHLRARGSIIIDKALMHSEARCKNLRVTGDKALIVGGSVTAADEVSAKTIGSPVATRTLISVGVDDGMLKKMNSLEEAIKSNLRSLAKLEKAVNLLEDIKEKTGSLPEDKEATLAKTKALHSQLDGKIKGLESQLQEVERKIDEARGGRVKVSDRIYPGVIVTIRKAVHQVKDEIRYATLSYEKGYIKINPF